MDCSICFEEISDEEQYVIFFFTFFKKKVTHSNFKKSGIREIHPHFIEITTS